MKTKRFDPKSHRALHNYDRASQVKRVLWQWLAQPLLRICVPRFLYEFRNTILRIFGAKIGNRVRIYPSANIFYPWNVTLDDDVTIAWDVNVYSLGDIHVGEASMISQGSHLCAGSHDISEADRPLLRPAIKLGKRCWLAADVFIGPGIQIKDDAIVGARAVVTKDVDAAQVVAGNPARPIKTLDFN